MDIIDLVTLAASTASSAVETTWRAIALVAAFLRKGNTSAKEKPMYWSKRDTPELYYMKGKEKGKHNGKNAHALTEDGLDKGQEQVLCSWPTTGQRLIFYSLEMKEPI